jgi:hypothetical protein
VRKARGVLQRLARRIARPGRLAKTRQALAVQQGRTAELKQRLQRARREMHELRSLLDVRLDTATGPSFKRKLDEAIREWRHGTEAYAFRDAIWTLDDKLAAYAFVAERGIAHPEVFGTYEAPTAVDWSATPDRFVLKCVEGASGRGVFPLVRQESGGFVDVLRGGDVTPQEVIDQLESLHAEGHVGYPLIAEALLGETVGGRPQLPDDWKLYSFFGEVELIMLKRPVPGSRQARYRFFDGAWRDAGPVRYRLDVDPTLPMARHPDQLVDTAARLSRDVEWPFVRIDLYDTAEGVVFGEFTFLPGGAQLYPEDIDRRLGAAWEDAEVRLRRLLRERGSYEHLDRYRGRR